MRSVYLVKKEDREVLDGLAIRKHTEFCDEYENQYPVLFISLKDVEGLTFDAAVQMLKNIIADLYKEKISILENKKILKSDADIFRRLMNASESLSEVENALKTIMRMMYSAYGKQVMCP